MPVSGVQLPTYAVSTSQGNWYDDAWVNPTYIYLDDSTGASVTAVTFDAGDQTTLLKASGFDFSVIPDGSDITGVTCIVNTWSPTTDQASMDMLSLLTSTGGTTGTNQCSTPVAITTATTFTITKGSSTDLWGCSLSAAWVKSTAFGVAMGCIAGGSGNNNVDVYIDYVSLQIAYNDPTNTHQLFRGGVMSGGGQYLTSSIQFVDMKDNLNRYKNRED